MLLQPVGDDPADDADQHPGGDAGNAQYRQVVDQLGGLGDQDGHDDLPRVVGHAPGDADPHRTELLRFIQQRHNEEAQYSPGCAVDHGKDIAEHGPRQHHPDQGDDGCILRPQGIQGEEDDDIGQSHFYTRHRHEHRNQGFQVAQDQRQGNQKPVTGDSFRIHIIRLEIED